MFNSYAIPSRNQNQAIMILQMKNQELAHDNLALSKQIFRLREILAYYQQKFVYFRKAEDYHNEQVQQINKNTKQILHRIQKSDDHTSLEINNKIKQLKKQVFYKKVQQLQAKYDKKSEQCQQLLEFKNKIERLRNTWDLKSKDKSDSNSLQSLFIWVYNQIVKGRSANQSKPKKSQHGMSKSKNNENKNPSPMFNITQSTSGKINNSMQMSNSKSNLGNLTSKSNKKQLK